MQYYLNGQQISQSDAWMMLATEAMHKGYDQDDVHAIWKSRAASEEARDYLFELSDCALEIIAPD